MNILLVTPFFTPQTGGVATFVNDARRFLSQRGHDVYVLRTGNARTIRPCALNRDPRVFEFYLRSPWVREAPLKSMVGFWLYLFPTLWRLANFLRTNRIQMVSLEYPQGCMLYFHLLRRWSKVKLIVGLHGDDVLSLHLRPFHEQRIVRFLIRRADWVLAHSASLIAQAETIVGGMHESRSALPYGIDCELIRERSSCSRDDLMHSDRPFILTVAKLYSRKGIDTLLHAIQKAKAFLANHQFLIVGDGPEDARLKHLAHELGVEECVLFAGNIPNVDIPCLFRQARFFVLPSRSEPFGIVLLEAMAFGKAILATRVGGIPEFVSDGVSGLLVPKEDPEALAAKLRVLIEQDDFREQLGRNGLALVESEYDYPVLIKRYEDLFARVIGCPTLDQTAEEPAPCVAS